MKKNLFKSALALTTMAFVFISGCTPAATPGPAAAPAAPPAANQPAAPADTPPGDVNLRFSWWGADARHIPYQNAIELFESLNPHIRISGEFQGFDGYRDRILTQMAGGAEPDIMILDLPWYPEIVASGDFFLNINDFPGLFDFSAWDYGFVEEYGYFDGRLLALPMGYNSRAFLINADAAERVGGLNFGERYTWETLYEDGVRINQANPDVFLASPTPNELLIISTEFLRQKTGNQLFTDDYQPGFTEEDLLELYNWVLRCYRGGVFQPLGEAALFAGSGEQNPAWISGNVIGSFQWTAGVTRFQSTLPREGAEMDIIPYPQHHNALEGAALMRPIFMISVSSRTQHPEEAISFINFFLNDPEAGGLLGSSNGTPVSQTHRDIVLEQGLLDPVMIRGINMGMENAASRENALSTNAELLNIMQDILAEVAMEGTTPEEAASRTMEILNATLTRLSRQ